jgi:hypothetical protein
VEKPMKIKKSNLTLLCYVQVSQNRISTPKTMARTKFSLWKNPALKVTGFPEIAENLT